MVGPGTWLRRPGHPTDAGSEDFMIYDDSKLDPVNYYHNGLAGGGGDGQYAARAAQAAQYKNHLSHCGVSRIRTF